MASSGMSLRTLAKVLGVSQPFLSQVRAGKRPLPEQLRVKVEALGAYHLLITQGPQPSVPDTTRRSLVDIAEVSGSRPLPPTTCSALPVFSLALFIMPLLPHNAWGKVVRPFTAEQSQS